jgi:hypothetical protein
MGLSFFVVHLRAKIIPRGEIYFSLCYNLWLMT